MRKPFFWALIAAWVIVGGLGVDVPPAQAEEFVVPLPSTVALLGLGLALLSVSRRENK